MREVREVRRELAVVKATRELRETQRKKEKYEGDNRIEFWRPWEHQQKAIDLLFQGKKTLIVQGGNQIGKTTLGVCLCAAAVVGYQPWDGKEVSHIFGKPPIKIRILCANWEQHAKEVIVPKLKEWLPVNKYITKKNNVGVEAYFTYENKSTIELLTHLQDTKGQEGWTGYFVWADEPVPRDKYSANKRGLLFHSGVFLLTMTAIYEPWIKRELIDKPTADTGFVLGIPMKANPLLKERDIEEFKLACPAEEKEARVEGGWKQLAGLIVDEFDINTQVVDSFKVPPDWPVIGMYDFHPGKPQAISFYALDKYNRLFVIYEIWETLGPEEVANEIIRLKQKHIWKVENFFIDPLAKGDTVYIKHRGIDIPDTYSVVSSKIEPYGITTNVATKDINSGIENIKQMCKNKPPTLYIFRNCVKHIEQIMGWIKDPNTGKPKKGKDIEDDFMENLYRATLAGIVYEDIKENSKIFKNNLNYIKKGII